VSGFFGRLNFVHRQLWRQDGAYLASILLGPAALAGLALAAGAWWGVMGLHKGDGAQANRPAPSGWAVPKARDQFWDNTGEVIGTVKPDAPLPPPGADGIPTGFQPGWDMYTGQLQVNAIDAALLQNRLTRFSQTEPGFDMTNILTAGPKGGPLYVGVGNAFLVVRTAGVYGLSVRLERPASEVASCLTRLGFGGRRVVSNLDFDIRDDVLRTFYPIRFDLQPGLYRITMVFGCWHDQEPVGPGRATVVIARPGEQAPTPATAQDLVRMEQRTAPGAPAATPAQTSGPPG